LLRYLVIMQKLALIAPTKRERRALPQLARELDLELIWDDFAGDYFDDFREVGAATQSMDIVALIEESRKTYAGANLAGITSAVGYPGMSVVSVLANQLGLPGPSPEAIILCEHKYYSRVAQQLHVPDATPKFWLVDPNNAEQALDDLTFPIFLKPVKSCMSMNAYVINCAEDFIAKASHSLLPQRFFQPFDDILSTYTDLELSSGYLIAEELLHGKQVSLEGYVFNGQVTVMGIIDAVFFPGSISFSRFQYPSKLPPAVLARMEDIAHRFFTGMKYDNAMFNMELMYNEETEDIKIIEINPKIASQFPDFFERVDGTSSYKVLLQIAAGRQPTFTHRQGAFKVAASCVLRIFEDQKVLKRPTAAQIAHVEELYPTTHVQIYATEGKCLSEQIQDSASFRYGLVNLGAQSEEELLQRFEHCKQLLPFEFEPVREPALV
jgi:biotin carboxylase